MRLSYMFSNACCVMILFATSAVAQSGGESSDTTSDKAGETVEMSISKDGEANSCLGACTINFSKELGVSFDYLDTIGSRIHEARKLPDPVALAVAAKSLEAAERVAEKQASVSAQQVMDEAVNLAKLRDVEDELRAIAYLLGDADVSSALLEQADVASERAPEEGESSKDLIGELVVTNHTHECLRIYVDGHYIGIVHEGHTAHFHVHSHNNPTHLDAYCTQDGHLISHQYVWGHRHHFYWHIGH